MGSRGSSRGELSDGPLKMAALVPRACGYVTSHGKRTLQNVGKLGTLRLY